GIRAISTDQAKLSIYAAERFADHLLTLVIINKSKTDLKSVLTVQGHSTTKTEGLISSEYVHLGPYAQVYRYSGTDLKEIVRRPDQPVKSDGFTAEYAAHSATMIILPINRTYGGLTQ
ncbi:MAG: endoglucanase, partial [Chthonomonadales bacterium]|nr:endoglucanase [Chthonomonadales bacterium]